MTDAGALPPDSGPPGERSAGEPKQPHPVLVLVLGFLSAFGLAACCLCGGALWWFRPVIHEDPEQARLLTKEIANINIIDSYQPKGTIVWNVAFLLKVRGAYYERFAGDGLLMLVEVTSRFRTEEDVRRHIRQTLEEKGGGGAPLIVDDSLTKRHQVVIRGEPVEFVFKIGKSAHTGRKYHLVEGVFEGNSGEVLLAMRVDDDVWNEEEVVQMIRSIQ